MAEKLRIAVIEREYGELHFRRLFMSVSHNRVCSKTKNKTYFNVNGSTELEDISPDQFEDIVAGVTDVNL